MQAVMKCFHRIGPHCRLAPPNQTDDTLGRWGAREASGTNNQDPPPYDETSHSRHHAVAAVHLFRIVVMSEKLLQGKNDGPVIFLQLDSLFPGLPQRSLQ